MKQVKSTQEVTEAEVKFWEHYAELLNKDGVTRYKAGYMIQRAQEFAYSLNGRRQKSVEEKDIERWPGELGRNRHLEGFRIFEP